MSQDSALELISQMLITASQIAAPMLLTSLVIGLLISIFQVVTQVQEMTLTFVPKIIASVAVVLIFGGWMLTTLVNFTVALFNIAAGG